MTSLEILNAVVNLLTAIPLDADGDPSGEPLFEVVQLAPNKDLADQLRELLVTKARVCLVVPLNVQRLTSDQSGGLSVMGTKRCEVAIVYSDRGYFKSGQVVTFGGTKNLGLLGFDDKLEEALNGQDIAELGGIVCGDSDPVMLTDAQQKEAPGRHAWMMQIFVPTGLIAAAVG